MMKILFAPSEGKREEGRLSPVNPNSFVFPELYDKRNDVMERYQEVIRDGSNEVLEALFGLKESKEFDRYKIPFETAPTMKAIERYDGVAYEYLNYSTLSAEAQTYIDVNTIIFSNLFGPIGAGDTIPDYKFKQGSMIGVFAPEKFYKNYFSDALDEIIENEEVLDLRAGFYDKFYTPKKTVTTLKFLKEGKVVSHWAKAYRGFVLRTVAENQCQGIDALLSLSIEGLVLDDVIELKRKREAIYRIV
jgi:cytoplasmic iron level regulating protein YaaA (DUF328/UPF0246 family)